MLLVLAYSKSCKFGFSLEKANMVTHRASYIEAMQILLKEGHINPSLPVSPLALQLDAQADSQ